MNHLTPLSEIKTIDQLLSLFVSEGWQKSPTREPLPGSDGMSFDGSPPIDAPCWETSCDSSVQRDGFNGISLHPGLGEEHGDVRVMCYADSNGVLSNWIMTECYVGSVVDLDAESICLSDLLPQLTAWHEVWLSRTFNNLPDRWPEPED